MTGERAETLDVVSRLAGGLCCPACRGPLAWDSDRVRGACTRCHHTAVTRGGRIVDFEQDWTTTADNILSWSLDFPAELSSWLHDLRDGRRPPSGATEELTARGLMGESGELTWAGITVDYHLEEARRQEGREGIDAYCERTGVGTGSEVLDVGCGAGQTLRAIGGHWPAGRTGVDNNPEALALGACLVRPNDPPLRFVRATGDALPFADGAFTHVVSRVALNYMRQGPALAEMVRVLRPGGFLYCRVEGPGFDLRLLRERRGGSRRVLGHLRNLFWGAVLDVVGWQPAAVPGSRLVCWDRAFATARRLRRTLGKEYETLLTRPTGWHLGLPLGVEFVAQKRP